MYSILVCMLKIIGDFKFLTEPSVGPKGNFFLYTTGSENSDMLQNTLIQNPTTTIKNRTDFAESLEFSFSFFGTTLAGTGTVSRTGTSPHLVRNSVGPDP
jgi:hypothetical protein